MFAIAFNLGLKRARVSLEKAISNPIGMEIKQERYAENGELEWKWHFYCNVQSFTYINILPLENVVIFKRFSNTVFWNMISVQIL